MTEPKLQFLLKGFTQSVGIRVYSFDAVGADRARMTLTVSTNLALAREYGIRLQDLPLLCRQVLTRWDGEDAQRAFTFSEDEMRTYADTCRAAQTDAALKRELARRNHGHSSGGGWRTPAV